MLIEGIATVQTPLTHAGHELAVVQVPEEVQQPMRQRGSTQGVGWRR